MRAGEARRLIQDRFEPVLKQTRWCVLKRKENVTGNQRIGLRDILMYHLQTVQAYFFKEQFARFWNYDSPTWARKFLDQWIALVMRSRIEPLRKSPGLRTFRITKIAQHHAFGKLPEPELTHRFY